MTPVLPIARRGERFNESLRRVGLPGHEARMTYRPRRRQDCFPRHVNSTGKTVDANGGGSFVTDYAVAAVLNATNGGTVDKVTFGQNFSTVEVLNRSSTATLWLRVDGVDPVAEAHECYPVPPGAIRQIEIRRDVDEVRVLATAGTLYTVCAF